MKRFALVLGSVLLVIGAVQARTISLTAEDADEMACIASFAPRLSWVMAPANVQAQNTQPTLYWYNSMSLLMRFPIKDLVPEKQRITKAELMIAPTYVAGTPQVHVRRLLAEWGPGVCHDYRMTFPKKVEWSQPGAKGNADRNNKATAVFKFAKVGEQSADVTEDIELWYTGGAPNRGWLLTLEPEGHVGYFYSPYTPQTAGAKSWKLQITFEPQ
ncbi:MAG TPA: hypothetical protein VFE62_28735 [Gemmataceae bacterium]|nr:hypothetical protein [Gemmataceae bacterium]